MIRGAAGQNTHPEPTTFCQLFRLLSVHSLLRRPRGSNISGGLLLKNLINVDMSLNAKEERMMHFELVLDEIVEEGKFK